MFSYEFCEISKNTFCYRTPPACNCIKKETLAKVFSCEFCKVSKNTCYRTPPVAASVYCRKKIAAVKIEKLKAFIIKYYDISKLILYSSTCSIQLTCHIFIFSMVFSHQFSINTLNCWMKLNKDNNRSFLVPHTTSIPAILSKHNYLVYKNEQYKSCNPKLVKDKL